MISAEELLEGFNRLSEHGEPGIMFTHCPVLVDECCQAVYDSLCILDSLELDIDVPPVTPFFSAHPGIQEKIHQMVIDTLSGQSLKARNARQKYHNSIAIAAIKRACERHNHKQHRTK